MKLFEAEKKESANAIKDVRVTPVDGHCRCVGSPCGTKIQKIQYLGGTCYFCPKC
jgi:hypothetical protein